MEWPKEIPDLFSQALETVPAQGYTRLRVIRELLDETARRAVKRAGGDPTLAGPALRSPYTPTGSVINGSINGRATRISQGGPSWGVAVEAFHGQESHHDSLFG